MRRLKGSRRKIFRGRARIPRETKVPKIKHERDWGKATYYKMGGVTCRERLGAQGDRCGQEGKETQ